MVQAPVAPSQIIPRQPSAVFNPLTVTVGYKGTALNAGTSFEPPATLDSGTTQAGILEATGTSMRMESSGPGGRMMITDGDAAGQAGPSGVSTNSISKTPILVLSDEGNQLTITGGLMVAEQGRTVTATPSNPMQTSIPHFDRGSLRMTTADYNLGGRKAKVTVGISNEGVLLIKVPQFMRTTLDDSQIAVIGITIAEEKLAVETTSLRGVLIEVAK